MQNTTYPGLTAQAKPKSTPQAGVQGTQSLAGARGVLAHALLPKQGCRGRSLLPEREVSSLTLPSPKRAAGPPEA